MTLFPPIHPLGCHGQRHIPFAFPSISSAGRNSFRECAKPAICSLNPNFEDSKERIRKMFNEVHELSISAYDTAWVAMVPSSSSLETPCFPGTLNWILDNQHHDGSWGLPDRHPLLIKDALSSTLACVLVLKRWHVGEKQITEGLDFIRSNFGSVMNKELHSPIGFDVIFPSMMEQAIKMDVNFRVQQHDIEAVMNKKVQELERIKGKSLGARNHNLAYISEGLGKLQDWEMAMTYQRKNGSLFNSPSATAAALLYLQNSGCYSYLHSVLQQSGDHAVPTVYPLETLAQLCLVDKIQRLGIGRHFTEEIRRVMDATFWLWKQGHEDIFCDISTCALAFRLLRLHGFSVSSESLAIYGEEECRFDRFGGHLKDIIDALELFRASDLLIDGNDSFLEKQNSWSRSFLKRQLNHSIQAKGFAKFLILEVDDALKNPHYTSVDRMASRRYMECYNLDNISIQKTSFRNIQDDVFLKFAVEDFNYCQSTHRQELSHIKRWFTKNKFDQLYSPWIKILNCYLSTILTIFSPELADARMALAKSSILVSLVDDFFDCGASEEEQLELIQLIDRWDTEESAHCYSENVHILFSALQSTISEIADHACRYQDRDVTSHIIDEWRRLIESMWKEAEMMRKTMVPTTKEYLDIANITSGMGAIFITTLYLMGTKLSKEAVGSVEYLNMFELMNTCTRLLNDIQGGEREAKQGKLNALSLSILHGEGVVSAEDAIKQIRSQVMNKRRELLKLVLQSENSVVPRACKDLSWNIVSFVNLLYAEDDGNSERLKGIARRFIQEPVVLE